MQAPIAASSVLNNVTFFFDFIEVTFILAVICSNVAPWRRSHPQRPCSYEQGLRPAMVLFPPAPKYNTSKSAKNVQIHIHYFSISFYSK